MGVHVCVHTELRGEQQMSSSVTPTYFFRAGSLHEPEAQVVSASVEANKPSCLSVSILLGAGVHSILPC